MSTATVTKPEATDAPVITVPAPVAPVLQANGVSVKPEAKDASNADTLVGEWLKAEAHVIDKQISALVDNVSGSVESLVDAIMAADEKKVWKTLGYRSLKMWVSEVLEDKLKNWSKPARTSLVSIMVAKGFSGTDVARMTGVSESTVSRDASGKPAEPSTPISRARKAIEKLGDNVTDKPEDYPVSDRYALAFDTLATLTKIMDSLVRDGHNVTKIVTGVQLLAARDFSTSKPARTGAEGTVSTGVAPKPNAPKPGK